MATPTYVPLATYTVTGSADPSITFSSIPATYRDLILIVGNLSATAANSLYARFNGDTGSSYSWVSASGSTSGTLSFANTGTSQFWGAANQGLSTTTPGQAIMQIMDYSATDKHKTLLARQGSASRSETDMTAGRWANSANAINQVDIFILPSGSFNVGTTFSLFGIA